MNFRISRSTLNLASLAIERQRQWCKMIHLKGCPFNMLTYGQSYQTTIVSMTRRVAKDLVESSNKRRSE